MVRGYFGLGIFWSWDILQGEIFVWGIFWSRDVTAGDIIAGEVSAWGYFGLGILLRGYYVRGYFVGDILAGILCPDTYLLVKKASFLYINFLQRGQIFV